MPKLKVSLCTACKGRLHHLKRTLPRNIQDSAQCKELQFVLLDYSSPDGLDKWLQHYMGPHLESGRLLYLRIEGQKYFRFAHARNLMFKAASGDIVCNVDADIIVKSGYALWLQQHFAKKPNTLVSPGGDKTGRGIGWLALLKRNFLRLGGYDERFNDGWGFEDNDLVRRAKALGIPRVGVPKPFGARISHGEAEKVQFAVVGDPMTSKRRHRRISAAAMKNKKYVTNKGRPWGAGTVTVNFGQQREIT